MTRLLALVAALVLGKVSTVLASDNMSLFDLDRGLRPSSNDNSYSYLWDEGLMMTSKDDNLNDKKRLFKETKQVRPSLFRFHKKKGRIAVDLSRHPSPALNNPRRILQQIKPNDPAEISESITVSIDPFAAVRLMQIVYLATSSFLAAFAGTLKLLGPMIFARRVLAQVGELISDYMMGRYLRTTYDRIEREYWREYQGPAVTRSMCRCLLNLFILLQLGYFMEDHWLSLGSAPCVIGGTTACHWWCGLLWILSVIGIGNIGAVLLATRGPLKIKVSKSAVGMPLKKRKQLSMYVKPISSLLQWMKDPDRYLTAIATSRRDNARCWNKPFTPEPLLFPSTFPPFNILRNIAVAKAMATSSSIYPHSRNLIMRQFLFQHALMDEWHRVLMEERRVGLGSFLIALGFVATSFLFVSIALVDSVSAVLMLPWLVATFSSGWMTLFCYWERRRARARQNLIVVPVLTKKGRYRRNSLGTKTYAIKW